MNYQYKADNKEIIIGDNFVEIEFKLCEVKQNYQMNTGSRFRVAWIPNT